MNDTPPEIEERMIQLISRKTPTERLKMASSMYDFAKKLVIAGLLLENKNLNEAQLRARTFIRMYSDCFTREEIERIVKHIPNMQLDPDYKYSV
jgi:hypothetical protein